MKPTHHIDFFSNILEVVVEGEVIVKACPKSEYESVCCPECEEEIAGYWLVQKGADGKLKAMCPSEDCGIWPLVDLKIKANKK